MQWGLGGVTFPDKKHYEGILSIMSVTRGGWVLNLKKKALRRYTEHYEHYEGWVQVKF